MGKQEGRSTWTKGLHRVPSSLSLAIWLIYLADILRKAQKLLTEIDAQGTPTRRSKRLDSALTPTKELQVDLFSYADDVNPLVISSSTTEKEHSRLCQQVDWILEGKASQDHLEWDPSKDRTITFSSQARMESTVTLGILIHPRLSCQPHIDPRTSKAEQLLGVMLRLGKSNGGLSPGAYRSHQTDLHMGCRILASE